MSTKPLKIAIIVDVMPSYRGGFYDIIFNNKDIIVTVYTQNSLPGVNLNLIHDRYPNNVKVIKFVCAKRERVGWQFNRLELRRRGQPIAEQDPRRRL